MGSKDVTGCHIAYQKVHVRGLKEVTWSSHLTPRDPWGQMRLHEVTLGHRQSNKVT